MNIYCDLHIHSCLSPCGDALMTPNNIVGMAYIKELDAIAVCDHNACRNLPAEKNRVMLNTREEAVLGGYSPCGNCKP